MKTRIFLFVLFLIISGNEFAFAQLYDVSRYADDSGLPSRIVRDVIQDQNGFIWVAGNNGLYKFDGQKFLPFYSVLKDSTGLRDNKITAILETQDHKIIIGTPKGLHRLESDSISHYTHNRTQNKDQNYIRSLIEDEKGNIWIGTYGGLFVIDKLNEESYSVSHPDIGGIPEHSIDGLVRNKNSIWITSNNRLFVNRGSDLFKFDEIEITYDSAINQKSIILFRVIDHNPEFMLFESNFGLLKATIKSDKHLHLSHFLDPKGQQTAKFYIYKTIVDYENNIWIATWKNRFKKYKVSQGQLIQQDVISTNGNFLNMSANAMSLYEDAQRNIWIPNTNGLYKLSAINSSIIKFPPTYLPDCLKDAFSIYALKEDQGGNFWITTPYDLYRIKKSDLYSGKCPEDIIHIKNENMQLVRNLYIDSNNRLWLGAENGLFVSQLDANYDPGEFFRFTKEHGLPHNWCQDIYEEDADTFWVGTYGGLVKLKIDNNDIGNSEVKTYTSDTSNESSLANSYTIEIASDKNKNKWFGTFFGLSRLIAEEDEGTFANYFSKTGDYSSLSNDAIKRLFLDSSERLWVGTQTGLNLYDHETDSFLQLGRNEGLPSEYILGIDEDSQGYLWVATTNGVIKAKFNESQETFTNISHYTKKEGLTDNITYRNALYIDTDDTVFIGSRNGISILGDQNKQKQNRPFNLAITSFETIKKDTSEFSSMAYKQFKAPLKLSHRENSIKLNYAVLDLTTPQRNRYRHKILPLNEDWIETKNGSEIVYYNLQPGKYQMVLDGSNNQEAWSQKPLTVDFEIIPPFWKSNLAKIAYLLIFLGVLRMLFLFRIKKRVRQLEQQAKLERALVNEREQLRQENTADFHDELGSKVTKISLFLTLAERNLNERKDPSEWLSKIRENVKDLSGGFRDLLWVIDPKKDSFHDTIQRLKDYGEDLFNNGLKQFSVKGHLEEKREVTLDPKTKKQVVMIFKEAMSNCAKYSECQKVEVIISHSPNTSTIELRDDGIGFEVKKKSKGRGLKNMIDRASKINAELTIFSNDEGTSIKLARIPHMRESLNSKSDVT